MLFFENESFDFAKLQLLLSVRSRPVSPASVRFAGMRRGSVSVPPRAVGNEVLHVASSGEYKEAQIRSGHVSKLREQFASLGKDDVKAKKPTGTLRTASSATPKVNDRQRVVLSPVLSS